MIINPVLFLPCSGMRLSPSNKCISKISVNCLKLASLNHAVCGQVEGWKHCD